MQLLEENPMYGLREGMDLSFLRGREVIQIAIGVHQVIFAFDGDIGISLESEFCTARDSAGSSTWRGGEPRSACPALSPLGAVIVDVNGREDETLILVFSDKKRPTIYDSREFESYTISRPGETIVVQWRVVGAYNSFPLPFIRFLFDIGFYYAYTNGFVRDSFAL
jgi:hypothetical protein